MAGGRILIVDNYDSFTYNLVQYLGVLGAEPVVRRNDRLDPADIELLEPDGIVISPGSGAPSDAGVSRRVLLEYGGKIKTLGICLGYQVIAEAFGGKVVRAAELVHGKTSDVHHDGKGVLAGVESPFEAARYHSLVVDEGSLPDCLTVTGRTTGGVVMGVRHVEYPVEGIQFHPESFMTGPGMRILENFLEAP